MELWSYAELVPFLIISTIFYVAAIICYIVLITKAKKFFFLSTFSLLCVFFYFTPWLIPNMNIDLLTPYVISFIWFLIAWIFVIVKLIKILAKNPVDKHEIQSLVVVGLCYISILVVFLNGLYITV